MRYQINGTSLEDINKTKYGNEAEIFSIECTKFSVAYESISNEFLRTDSQLLLNYEGTEGLVWSSIKGAGSAISGAKKAGTATFKMVKRGAADFKVFLKKLYEQLQKLIREYGVQLSARWARLMKVADRYKQVGTDVREIINFLGKAVGDLPEMVISWHRFDPQLLKTMFDSVENFEVFHKRVLDAAAKAEGVRNIPDANEVKAALDRDDKKALSEYVNKLSKTMHYFNENKELSVVVGLSEGDFDSLERNPLLVRMCQSLGITIGSLFTGGKFRGWTEIAKVKTNKSFRNVSDDTKKKVENKELNTTGPATFLKEAILGEEFRVTYSSKNAEEFKKDMLGTIGFLTLMNTILNNQLIFNVLKSGSLSIKKETDAKLREIQNIINSADRAAVKEEQEEKAKETKPEENKTEDETKKAEEKKADEELNPNASAQDLADLYIKLMGGILSRCCADYSSIVSACLASTFTLVKETEAIVKTIHSFTTRT